MVLSVCTSMGVIMRVLPTPTPLFFCLSLSLSACGTATDEMQDAGQTADSSTEQTTGVIEGPAPAELAVVTNGTCPDLSTPGRITFTSGGVERQLILLYPSEMTEDMPVIFHWHPLGGSASMMVQYLQLQSLADTHQVVIVVPDLRTGAQTWGFFGDPSYDLALYDDMRSCLAEQVDIDLWRVSTSGMSAGGLWSTYLSMHRADSLATAFIMSGGTQSPNLPYKSPSQQMPVLLTWGGPQDTWGSGAYLIKFEETMADFSMNLRRDGHFVVGCDHNGGHIIPREAGQMAAAWLLNHSFGKPSPFVNDLSGLPSYCVAAP